MKYVTTTDRREFRRLTRSANDGGGRLARDIPVPDKSGVRFNPPDIFVGNIPA